MIFAKFSYLIVCFGVIFSSLSANAQSNSNFTTLYNNTLFKSNNIPWGNIPWDVVISPDGSTLYQYTYGSYGRILSISTKSGKAKTLHDFNGWNYDGWLPIGHLTVSSNGKTLFGCTEYGGQYGFPLGSYIPTPDGGTVFLLDSKSGSKTILHSFGGNGDIGSPSPLILSQDGKTLYGTLSGINLDPTPITTKKVFSIDTTSGAESDIYNFQTDIKSIGLSQLTLSKDEKKLYGIFYTNETNNPDYVYSLDIASKSITVLYSFGSTTNDGISPVNGLTLSKDGQSLYGATSFGGTYNSGTIFCINIAERKESIIHHFGSTYLDNGQPGAALTLSPDGNTLYGNTMGGIIFSIDIKTHNESILYSFPWDNYPSPRTSLAISSKGDFLYGTTQFEGAYSNGIIFSLSLNRPIVSFTQPATPIKYSTQNTFNLIGSTTSGGPITFSSSNTNVISVNGSTATVTGVGSTTLTATSSSFGAYTSASVSRSLKVVPGLPIITFTQPSSPIPYSSGMTFTLSATSSSGGGITFSSSNPNVIAVSGTHATVKGVGTATIKATSAATTNYTSAFATRTVTVKK